MKGRVNSFQSFGASDGPGVRAVLFMQGCLLRCKCCHNPETWDFSGGEETDVDTFFDKIMRCRAYFGEKGGVTASGGEPLLQPEFLTELFLRLKAEGVNTALDTSGCILNDKVKKLLQVTDIVLLDYKYTDEKQYYENTLCEKKKVDEFLSYLDEKNIRTWIRQVIIPTLNDSRESVIKLASLKKKYRCVEKTELLPFRKLCENKYDEMGIEFPLKDLPEASSECVMELQNLL